MESLDAHFPNKGKLDTVTITRVEYEALKAIEALYEAQRPFREALMPSWAQEARNDRNGKRVGQLDLIDTAKQVYQLH